MAKTLVAHQNYKQIDYMRHFWTIVKKTHILQIVSTLILLIQNIVFSSINFFQQPRNLFLKVKETQDWLNSKFCAFGENWSK